MFKLLFNMSSLGAIFHMDSTGILKKESIKFGHICRVRNRHSKNTKQKETQELRHVKQLQSRHCFMEVSRGSLLRDKKIAYTLKR